MAWVRKLSELILGKEAIQAMAIRNSHQWASHSAYEREKEYIFRESLVGARVLGPIPSGHDREFFCLDEHTWIWRESWKDQNGQRQEFVVNYEVDPSGILKRVNGGQYTLLRGEELRRFVDAVTKYHNEVKRHVYGKPVTSVA